MPFAMAACPEAGLVWSHPFLAPDLHCRTSHRNNSPCFFQKVASRKGYGEKRLAYVEIFFLREILFLREFSSASQVRGRLRRQSIAPS